jgi:glycosyltransferase involved in cell wall biosynthesis
MSEASGGPSISVIVGVRNAAPTIQRCLDSVFAQTHDAVDLVVIDGESTDGTTAIIERNADRVGSWRSERDRSVYEAWNKALGDAKGEWICFLGSDDQLAGPTVMAAIASHLASAAGRYRVVYGALDVIDADGRLVRSVGRPWDEIRSEFRERMTLPHPATFHHRDLFRDLGPFDERYRIAGDYELLLRELLDHDALFVPQTVVRMGAGGMSNRATSRGLLLRETYRARRRHGLVDVPEWRSPALWRSVIHARLMASFGLETADAVGRLYRVATGRHRRERS